jgi:hypothetical protein
MRSCIDKVQFLSINLFEEENQLFDLLKNSNAPLLWISNIFSFIFTHMKYDLSEIQNTQNKFYDFFENKKSGKILGAKIPDDLFEKNKDIVGSKYSANLFKFLGALFSEKTL